MRTFTVTGMSCAACSARVEKAVSGVPGVDSCAVNLLTATLAVEGDAEEDAIARAVTAAGYGLVIPKRDGTAGSGAAGAPSGAKQSASEATGAAREFRTLRRCLIWSVGFVLVLMYISMGYHMFSAPLPKILTKPAVNAVCQMMLALVVMGINFRFFRNGVRGVLHGAPNMDTLVALGSFASFAYSVAGTIRILSESGDAHAILGDLYFDSAAMILALITVGKTLEAYSKGRTTDALRSLHDLAPKTARVKKDGEIVIVPAEEIRVGDIFVVMPGDAIPADGVILDGEGAIDESALTGESIPVDRKPGDAVATATLNRSGYLTCRATAVGEDNTLSKIIRMVSDATATKAPIAKTADRVAGVFVPIVIAVAILTAVIWLLVGQTFGYALARAVSVLVISCPCALGLATPVAIMVGSGVGAKHGILYKTAAALEQCGRAEIVALDKTGTITEGEPKVTKVVSAEGVGESELLRYALLAESRSEHPIGKAITSYCLDRGASGECGGTCEASEFTAFQALSGIGVKGTYRDKELLAGKAELLGSMLPAAAAEAAETAAREGGTPAFFAYDGRYLGMMVVADTLREDSASAVALLSRMGIGTVCVTGDRLATAKAIASSAGITEIRAEVMPDEKQQVVRELQGEGTGRRMVAMVGDGINDAPALTAADVGIAIGTGTEVAVDAADVVVMNRRLTDVSAALDLGRQTLKIIRQNLWWAFFYNVLGIPLAAGAYVKLFGWEMNPMFGAAAMSLSSFCVVMNALRLNRWKYPETETAGRKAEELKTPAVEEPGNMDKEETAMKEITLKVQGMMCAHCEARVKKCLEEIPGVESAVVSHEAGTAVVTASENVPESAMREAVTAQGYEVL